MKISATSKVLVAVELGSPAADCAHFGVCSIELLPPEQWAAFRPRHIRHLKALVTLKAALELRIEFPLEGMLEETLEMFFPATGFRVDSGTIIPQCLAEELQLTQELRTMPGLYAVEFSHGVVCVAVALQQAEGGVAIAA